MQARLLFLCLILLGINTFGQETKAPPPWPILTPATASEPLPGTTSLDWEGDLSLKLVETNDRFLDRMRERAAQDRERNWKRDFSSDESYEKSVEPNRIRLAEMLGLDRDERPITNGFVYLSPDGEPLAEAEKWTAHLVQWKAFREVHGMGVLIEPKSPPLADAILLSLDDLAGNGAALADSGIRVLIVALTGREENESTLSQREWLHRPAFELGRTLTGYEVHKSRAAIDCLKESSSEERPLGIAGQGDGGAVALYTAAIDRRVNTTAILEYFGPRDALWKEPADRNVFGLLTEFGDAEIGSLVLPRTLIVERGGVSVPSYRTDGSGEPEILLDRPEKRGKPSGGNVTDEEVDREIERLQQLAAPLGESVRPSAAGAALDAFAKSLAGTELRPSPVEALEVLVIPESYLASQIAEIEAHNQWALVQSEQERRDFFKDLKTDSLEDFEKTVEPYREYFRTEVIGDFALPLAPKNARTRPYQESPMTISYEVVLDVFDEAAGEDRVFAYGILTLPKDLDLSSGEKRPVVVCQHGLEGTPQQTIGEEKHQAYKAFATRLAERGFITFAPQNGYKYFDLFRLQQFEAQSIGKTLFSIIVPQHKQITDWLAMQPFVDGDRIAFYGLSYGGKSAMRIPPLVDKYCLSICSADFNDWVWKNAATDPASLRYSYANKGEYEIFEWDLGGTFNYSEMAALICPRPFMVERGHFDGVAPDERVAYEFAKVRNLYEAKLGLEGRCKIEWFAGPHTINGVGTFQFLERHLGKPE